MINHPVSMQHFLRILVLTVTFLGASATVQAHTGLKISTPADGAVVRMAPEQIELTFTAAVSLVRFGLKDHAGKAVELGFKPEAAARATFVVPVAALTTGIYHAEWAAIGEDGHTVTGEFAFTVDPAATEEHAGNHAGDGAHSH